MKYVKNLLHELDPVQKGFFNHEPHEKTWRGLTPTTHFLTTNHTKRHEIFFRVVALTDEMAREFVIWSIGFSD